MNQSQETWCIRAIATRRGAYPSSKRLCPRKCLQNSLFYYHQVVACKTMHLRKTYSRFATLFHRIFFKKRI